jgi:dGTPase
MMMNWNQLISNCRLGQEHRHPERHDDRTEFKRDYDRLIFSAPFRRLQNKTQVFPLPGSVFVHNRLTHSLEVASVGMSLGNDVSQRLMAREGSRLSPLVAELGQIVATACLAHDMGNPPFGHSGEKAIQTFFTEGKGNYLKEKVSPAFWDDITHFEGNANAFRLLTHQFRGRRPGGFVMTYSTLASIVKYPYSSSLAGKKGKFGFFSSEAETYQQIADELGIVRISEESTLHSKLRYARHPLVYLVEAADDICYEIMDLEDAHKLKLLSLDETIELMMGFFDEENQQRIRQRIEQEQLTDENEQVQYLRACVIGKLENECVRTFMDHEEEILAGCFEGSLIDHIAPLQHEAYQTCTRISKKRIYRSKPVLDVELSGYKIMATLMELMIEAIEHPERYYSQQLIGRVSSQYDIESPDLESRLMAVIDYISGMTDVYALDVYQKICGISLPIV